LGEGLLWAEPPVDFCNENETYEHIHEAPSASASDPRPLAESLVPRRLRSVPGKDPSEDDPEPVRRARRATHARPEKDSPPAVPLELSLARDQDAHVDRLP
jgi:hypothetical protein